MNSGYKNVDRTSEMFVGSVENMDINPVDYPFSTQRPHPTLRIKRTLLSSSFCRILQCARFL